MQRKPKYSGTIRDAILRAIHAIQCLPPELQDGRYVEALGEALWGGRDEDFQPIGNPAARVLRNAR